MTLTVVVVVGATLIGCGLGGGLYRRSLAGILIALELAVGGAVLLAAGLTGLAGDDSSGGQVLALALVAVGAAAAVLVLALHVAAARAARADQGLEPW